MDHIGANLTNIEQNIKLNTADPIALHGFTQLPNFILRNPETLGNAKTIYSFLQLRLEQQPLLSRPRAPGRGAGSGCRPDTWGAS